MDSCAYLSHNSFHYQAQLDPRQLARQISRLDGCKALRHVQPLGRKQAKWSSQLDQLLEKVYLLSELLPKHSLGPRLLGQVECRLNKLSRKPHIAADIAKVKQSQKQLSGGGCHEHRVAMFGRAPSPKHRVVELDRASSPKAQLYPKTKRTGSGCLLSLFMFSLYFHGSVACQTASQTSTDLSSCNPTHSWLNIGETLSELFEKNPIPDCVTSDCPDLNITLLFPKEGRLLKTLPTYYEAFFKTDQEWLRFRKDDTRKKVLFLSAEEDHSGALEPSNNYNVLKALHDNYDIKYAVFRSYYQICKQVRIAMEIDRIAHLFINGHGNTRSIVASEKLFAGKLRAMNDFSSCLEGLAPSATITLRSCSTGGPIPIPGFQNLAQSLADSARRIVIAANDETYGAYTRMISTNPPMVFHEQGPRNVFGTVVPTIEKEKEVRYRVFFPRYGQCQDLQQSKIHEREQAAIEAISEHLIQNHFLWEKPSFQDMQYYLRTCTQDLKPKFLYLTAENSAHPSFFGELLVKLGREFDLRFKVIKSYDDICLEVNQAVETGEVAGLAVHAKGKPDALQLSTDVGLIRRIGSSVFGRPRLFPECLSVLPSDARIFLIGGSTGSGDDPKANLAYRVAQASQRTVFAPDQPIHINQVQLASSHPIELYYKGSWRGTNAFQKFEPKS